MPEAFRLIDLPVWLVAFVALVLLIAGFVDGVVKFAENWPKFCEIMRQATVFTAYWCLGIWWTSLSYAALRVLVWLKIGAIIPLPDPDGTDPAGVATRVRTAGAAPAKRAPQLRVIQGGKSGTIDNILMPVLELFGMIRGAVALQTYRGLVFLFGKGEAVGCDDLVRNVEGGLKYRYFYIAALPAAAAVEMKTAAYNPTSSGARNALVDNVGIEQVFRLSRMLALHSFAIRIVIAIRGTARAAVGTVGASIWFVRRVPLTRSLAVFVPVASLSRAIEAFLVDPGRLRWRPVA